MGAESTLFLEETLDLISCTTIFGVLYGITFSLYCLCAWSLYLKLEKQDGRRQARFPLGYISLLLCCTTVDLAVNARVIQLAYIDHADFPGGPLEYESVLDSNTKAYYVTAGILDLIINIATMAIQIRRLWLIWNGTRYAIAVTILPALLLFSYIALAVPTHIVASFMTLDQLGISDNTGIAMDTAVYATLSAFTILVTGLIAIRLLLARRQHTKVMRMSEAASPYLSIVTMLVESYILESAWSLAAAISFALANPSYFLFITNDSTIKVIAYFLIVYRVETGRGWTKQTEEKLTTLQWNRGAQTATDEASDIRSRLPATASVMAADFLPVAHAHSAV